MTDNSAFKQKILTCLNAEEFKTNSRSVREELLTQNKATTTVFLDTIYQVIADKKAIPESRFYALLFLKLTTEHHNPQLVSQLAMHRTFLRILEEQAAFDKNKSFPERGSTFFSTNPTDKEKFSGSNYLALLLEFIKYLNNKYASTEKNWSNPFGILYRSLAEDQQVPFPSKFHFYKQKEQKAGEELPGTLTKSAELSGQLKDQKVESKTQVQVGVQQQGKLNTAQETKTSKQQLGQEPTQLQSVQKQEELQKKTAPTGREQEKVNMQTPYHTTEDVMASKSYAGKESEDVKNAKLKMNALKGAFHELLEMYNFNKVETPDLEVLLPYYYDNLTEMLKTFDETITVLLTSQDPQNEAILAEIMPLSVKAADLEQSYTLYKSKKSVYTEHRVSALRLLGSGETTTPYETPGREDIPLEKKPQSAIPYEKTSTTDGIAKTSANRNSNEPGYFSELKMRAKQSDSIGEKRSIQNAEIQKQHEVARPNQKAMQNELEPEREKDARFAGTSLERQVSPDRVQKESLPSFRTNEQHTALTSNNSASYSARNKPQEPKMAGYNVETTTTVTITEKKISDPLADLPVTTSEYRPYKIKSGEQNQQPLQQNQQPPQQTQQLPQQNQQPLQQNVIKSSKFQATEQKRIEPSKEEIATREEVKTQEVKYTIEESQRKGREEIKEIKSPQSKDGNIRRPIWDDRQTNKIETKEDLFITNVMSDSRKPLPPQQKETATFQNRGNIRIEDDTKTYKDDLIKDSIRTSDIKSPKEGMKRENIALRPSKTQEEEPDRTNYRMMNSLNPRVDAANTTYEGAGKQPMAQSMQLDRLSNAVRFTSNLKLRAAKDRTGDLQKIQEGIKRSFTISQKKLPSAILENHLADPVVLSKYEQELHRLKQENEMLRSSSVEGLGTKNQEGALKNTVTDLQKQIGEFQKEIEHLRKRNDTLEKSYRAADESTNESVKIRLQAMENENRMLKKKIDEASTVRHIPEENKTLQDRIRELSEENEWLSNTMNNLRRDNNTLSSKLIDSEDVPGATSNYHSAGQQSRHQGDDKFASNRITAKTELQTHHVNANLNSPNPSLQLTSPKGNSAQQFKSPDHDLFWNGKSNQLSPIGAKKNNTTERKDQYNKDSHYRPTIDTTEKSSKGILNKEFQSPRTQNVEVGKRFEMKVEKGPIKGRGGAQFQHHHNVNSSRSQDSSDTNERYETPDEDMSWNEEPREAGNKGHASVKTHVYQGESGGNFGRGGAKVGERQGHHIFSTYRVASDEKYEDQEGDFWRAGAQGKKVEYSSNQHFPRRSNEKSPESERRNAFESEGEWNEELRGLTVPSHLFVFDELYTHLHSTDGLFYFKMACLKNNCSIYENDIIQIAGSSSVVQDFATSKHQLKLDLIFTNKSFEPITEFSTTLTEGLNFEVGMKPERIDSVVAAHKQIKQTLLISFKTTPISCLQMNCRAVCGGKKLNFSMFLPTVMSKFMEFKYVDADEFRVRWKSYSVNTLKTESIQVDSSIVRNAYDFKKYFAYLVDLRPDDEYDFIQGKKSIKLGGIFELKESGSEYALQINLLPSQDVVFQIATSTKNSDTARFVLQNLVFLFKQ